VLEVALSGAARMGEEQAVDQAGGHDWRCLVFRKVAFTMYPIADVARARKFYEETFGLKRGSMGNQGSQYWIEYDLPDGGCLALTNFIPDKPSDAAGGTIALEVEDLDQHSPVCRMAVCLDSEGNSILLHQLKPKEKQ
jgi:predicted enzyme related to lactoylglutathione lyase